MECTGPITTFSILVDTWLQTADDQSDICFQVSQGTMVTSFRGREVYCTILCTRILADHYADRRINTGVDPSTWDRNLVSFGILHISCQSLVRIIS